MFSNQKLIVAGQYIHLYQYDKSIKYGEPNPLTGKNYNPTDSKEDTERLDSHIYRIRKAVKLLLQCNAESFTKSDGSLFRPIFCTLTFALNITTLKEANREFTKFTQRLNYAIYKRKISNLKYLVVPEFQARGAVHYHVIYFNLPFTRFIHKVFTDIWGRGFVWIETIKDTNHLTNYVSKYFTKRTQDSRSQGHKAYFCSKGLQQPVLYRDRNTISTILNTCDQPTFKMIFRNDFNETIYSLYKSTPLTQSVIPFLLYA